LTDGTRDDSATLQLLECWLPLAQELNETLGWGADASALEELIQSAAPLLASAASEDTARVILVVYHSTLRA
jgi:hypothetical protein